MSEVPESFQLDEEQLSPPRIRLTSKLARQKGSSGTIHCQFRCPEFLSRRIDEILAARLDPTIKTRSDVFIDAVFLWLNEWDNRSQDGANGLMRAQFALHKMQLERGIRYEFLEEAKRQLADLRQDGDVNRLRDLHLHLQMVYSDSLSNAPASFTDEVYHLMKQVDRLVEVNAD